MKTFKEFVRHLESQDNGVDLVDMFEKHIDNMDFELASSKKIQAAGHVYFDKDWIDEFFESDKAAPIYRHLARLALDPYGDHPARVEAGKVLADFREEWLCELAALDAQFDHDEH